MTNVIKKFLFIKTLTLTIAQIRVALMVVQARAALLTILWRRCSIFQILINTIFYRYQYFLKSSSRMSSSVFSRIVFFNIDINICQIFLLDIDMDIFQIPLLISSSISIFSKLKYQYVVDIVIFQTSADMILTFEKYRYRYFIKKHEKL